MTLRLVLIAFAVLGLSAIPSVAEPAPTPPIVASPTSGPPGTVVSLTGLAYCTTTDFSVIHSMIGLGLAPGSAADATTIFDQAPSGTFTIPKVPDGDYVIVLTCGGTRVGTVAFHVGIAAVAPIVNQPTLAG